MRRPTDTSKWHQISDHTEEVHDRPAVGSVHGIYKFVTNL